MTEPIFYIALFAHLVFLIMGFGAVIVIDSFGLLMVLGKTRLDLVKKVADITQRLIWIGWIGMIASGLVLITMKGYVDNLTKIKLFFVVLVGLNGVYLHIIKKALGRYGSMKEIPAIWKFRIGLASFISQMGWWGALFIGFVHRHIEHNIPWPANPWIVMVGIVSGLLALWIAGETAFRKKNETK